ncbi:MAG: hypothetical protein HUU47_10050 [Bacteroidetes bacterium]|nr:hypothetical protein [Bacteroidota bacterium]
MKKIIYLISFLALPLLSISATNEFSYDKNSLSDQFSQLEQVSLYVDQNNVTYSELSKNPLFKGNLDLTNHISVKPNFSFDDIDWIAFAWGFLCCPIGFFIVVLDDDKSKEEKTSFWIGVISSVVLSSISALATPRYYYY